MGEFGAVSVVSGHIAGQTDTLPLRVETLFNGASLGSGVAAFSVASLLALLALVTLILKTFLEWKSQRDDALAQETGPILEPETESDTVFLAKSFQ
jgi:sulfate transport system permease protein